MLTKEEFQSIGMTEESIVECANHYFTLLDMIDTNSLEHLGFLPEDISDITYIRDKYLNKYWNIRNKG